jgi:hypothetical protein
MTAMTGRSLHEILSGEYEGDDGPDDNSEQTMDTQANSDEAAEHGSEYCAECGDQVAELYCAQCEEQVTRPSIVVVFQ